MDLIKIYFSYIALCFLFALLLFLGVLLVIALVYLIWVFVSGALISSSTRRTINKEDHNEP